MKLIKRFLITLLLLALLAVGTVAALLWLPHPLPVKAHPQPLATAEARWWLAPPPLTPSEVAAQQWLSDITYRLPASADTNWWRVGGSQHGNYSIRYQAAFTGYAAALLGMRTPAYPYLTERVISNCVSRIADKRAWCYIQSYWRNDPWFPDPCAQGNIMYTGHLMMLMALHEALSGNPTYNHRGIELVWDPSHRYTYTTLRLAQLTADQIQQGFGGITCEPNLVFFSCNNHPHVTFRLLEGMGYGTWHDASYKWEKWALRHLRATAGGGALRLVHHTTSGASLPRGMSAFDGWSLLWYQPWSSAPTNAPRLWHLAQKQIDWREFDGPPNETPEFRDQHDCCNPLKTPTAPGASFMAAAARACGDALTATKIEAWLDSHFKQESPQRWWLTTDREWRIGTTANRFISLALSNGSNLRAMIRRPLPRDYFDGLLLDSTHPDDTPVYQAYRTPSGTLIIELDGHGRDITLILRNAPTTLQITPTPTTQHHYHSPTLHLPTCPHLTLTLTP